LDRSKEPDGMTRPSWQWEYQYIPRWRNALTTGWRVIRRPAGALVLAAFAFTGGMRAATGPDAPLNVLQLRSHLSLTENTLAARRGELELARLEVKRLSAIVEHSSRYRIPADLSAKIYDTAVAEGIDPTLAYRLVRVESEFYPHAISPVGAVGLTQLMPETAFAMNPKLVYADLFDQETNLRLGFRYLHYMLEKYNGDLRLALLAYNRGPGRVDEIREGGGNPANGYDRAVLGGS
jgi:soluble lytic murein transglycosylase-like protein